MSTAPEKPSAPFNYTLRIVVAPGFHEEDNLRRIVEFCALARVDEVMLFTNCEEINTGHLDAAELRSWSDVLVRSAAVLRAAGLAVSVNPWETLLHADRGRTLKPGQRFNLMVDPLGRRAGAMACPECPEWLAHMRTAYAALASVGANVIWLEDDFRFHNHAPLTWGGCFCDGHLRLVAEEHGAPVTREGLLEAVTAPGGPHPLRKLWLDLNGRTTLRNARAIREAVQEASPRTRLGLMTSLPSVHCAEGRDWPALAESLGGTVPPVFRPHLPAYSEVTPAQYLWNFTISRQTAALLPDGTDLHPEVDNGPHSAYSKSRSMMRFQMLLSSVLGSSGLTFNIFDMIGNGPLLDEGYQDAMAGVKPFLEAVRGYGPAPGRAEGIAVPFSPRSSYTIDTSPDFATGAGGYALSQSSAPTLERLYPDEGKWASLLSSFGVANRVTTQRDYDGEVVALSGQWLRNLAPAEIERLFAANSILLDGGAALTLHALGLGRLAGIRALRRIVPVSTGDVSYEQVADGTVLSGCAEARLSAQVSCGSAVIFDYLPGAHAVTELKDFRGATTGPGMVSYERRCLVMPFIFPDAPNTCILHMLRRGLITGLVAGLEHAPRRFSTVEGGAYLALFRFGLPGSTILIVANASTDHAERISLRLAGVPDGAHQALVVPSAGPARKVELAVKEGQCRLPFALPAMDAAAVILPVNNGA